MCNLYRLNKPAADIAHLFGVEATQGANYSEEVYPGYPGLVMAGRRLKVMNWGFPLVMSGRNGQKLKPAGHQCPRRQAEHRLLAGQLRAAAALSRFRPGPSRKARPAR
jgi:hypothetical protein